MTGLFENLTNPALLFFILGVVASQIKNDLSIPENSSKFISIYLLLSIGFKGGNELSHSDAGGEIYWSLLLGIFLAAVVPVFTYFILRRKLNTENSGAVAAAYGSVSAVTFVTAISFLEFKTATFGGHMIAVMALMEAPAIVVGIMLINTFRDSKDKDDKISFGGVLKHSLNNASVYLIIGSLIIGYLASDQQAEGIKPFTTDIFKGFLSVFLLDMGIRSGRHLGGIKENSWFLLLFGIFIPFVNGTAALLLASLITESVGNILLFAILGASASYIAVPAAMKNAVPKANPGIYLPMALGITFPVNVIIGIPFYFYLIEKIL
ncbi:sodium-dependent bicarbonate transport family permease [Salibacter halophilus]|uniref:Sodium-dependent bicarbonate transport family permease n=1 Tax=Salibacter halophilus TaxID=1803916 RepID=A0A6N6M9S3_9FLAO|nr:sodium-dependent bicarbonate transport family permease [Salibacter halophilus]KAB1065901.1 sodium-dependent bicarbonate transport family permease [Salibacter halophilus]